MLPLATIDEGDQVLRASFWAEPLHDGSGRVAYCWKQESWDCQGHNQPTIRWHHVHRIVETPLRSGSENFRAKRPACPDPYRSLPDEDMDFLYDPTQSLNQSSSYLALFEPSSLRPVGSVSPELQKWDALNEIQFWCRGCRLQQARGLFEGEEIREIKGKGKGPFKGGAMSLVSQATLQNLQLIRGYGVIPIRNPKHPMGLTLLLGVVVNGNLPTALMTKNTTDCCVYREIRHRHQNEEHEKALLHPSYPRKLVYKGEQLCAIAYHHPIVGSWIRRAEFTDAGEVLEEFYDDAPPLSCDFHMTDFSQPLNGWLELAAKRQTLRLQC